MSRVLLFADFGKGPRSLGYLESDSSKFLHRLTGRAGRLFTARQWSERERASRWWIVECENAEAGRGLIALTDLAQAARRYAGASEAEPVMFCGDVPPGRILDSGGKP